MNAAWYQKQGPAREVLVVGTMPDPEPGPAEVRIRVAASGVNPGDVKKRQDAFSYGMPYPQVIPHSDGAGILDRVGDGVPTSRVGERVWCYGAQSYRPFGTAAEYVVVPAEQAVPLPDAVSFEQGACLGIPGITAHRCVHAAGPVDRHVVLVQGGAGAVGSCAVQLARRAGARVIATVRSTDGRLQAGTDPAGTVTKYFYDNLGRKTYVAQNWQNFVPPSTGTGNPNDRVTQYVYYGPTQLQQLVAMDPNGDGNLSDNEATTYQYVDPVDATRVTSEVFPDSSTITLAYYVDGSLSQKTDPRGVVLSYAYTNNRLLAAESVTTLPSGVDGSVQSIAYTYDNVNRPQNITSYASPGGTGTVVNDIQYAYYDGMNKVATAYQEHKGAVNTSTSLNVQYIYDTTTTGAIYSNQLRLQTDVHPNGRTIYYDYGASSPSTAAYAALSNVREIWDGSPTGTGLAIYDYNGAGTRLAIATYPQPSFKLNHFEGTSGTYAGLDRFGRLVDQYWNGFGGTSDIDRIHYAYDYAGDRIYRQIDSAIYPTENMDQAYTYDRLNRLLTSQVGTLSGTTISGTPASEEDWTLDGLGNWPSYVQKTSGTVFLNQTRTATPANAISAMSATVGTTWVTPVYDLAGNMTGMPIPTNLTSLYTATYDAWNRLVSLGSGSTTVATYAYDGLNRRVVKGIYVSGTLDHNEHAYFNEKWQILEVRKEVSGTINSNPLEQHVWHTFYVDAPVLRDYDSATSGSPTRYYYAFDANYNVTAVTSAAGAPAERYYYSPYGTLLFLDASFNVLATQQTLIGNAQTYTGRQYDPESGLYFYRNRHYHSWLGMFCQRDSRGYADAVLNLYSYARLNPIVVTDPFGLCPCTYSGNQCCDYARANKLGGGAAAGIVCCQGTAIACVYDSGGFSHATDRVAQAIIDACLIAHEDSHLKDPNMLPCPDNCGIFSGGQMKQGTTMESECTAFTVEVECLDKLKGLCKNSRDPGKCEAQVAKEKQLANDEKGIYCGRGT